MIGEGFWLEKKVGYGASHDLGNQLGSKGQEIEVPSLVYGGNKFQKHCKGEDLLG